MEVCEYCNKELKSKGGLTIHLKSCKSRVKDKPITAEVCGVESDYYSGHPRRELKLRGLLSRTHNRTEREKICQIILTECK